MIVILIKLNLSLLFIIIIGGVFARDVYAYVDPGAGSYFIQLIMGLFLGGLLSVKLFWKNIKGFFAKLLKAKTDHEEKKKEPS